MMDKTFHLEWSNHLPNMQALLEMFYSHQDLVDVTLSCHDGMLKAHKIILSACSPYFEHIFRENPCKHPVLILKGISVREMQALLKFMYKGSVDIAEADLSSLVSTASEFKVKGFASGDANTSNSQSKKNEDREYEKLKRTKNALEMLEHSNLVYDCQEKFRTTQSELVNENLHHEVHIKSDISRIDKTQSQNENDTSIHGYESEPINEDNNTHFRRESATPRIVDAQSLQEKNADVRSNDNTDENSKHVIVKQEDVCEKRSAPYPRDTRFKGRKRVDVGFRLVTRTRSAEKREQELRNTSSVDRRDQDILEATGLVKRFKGNTNMKNDSQVASRVENGSYKSGTERSTTDGDADDGGRLTKYVPDIEIKEEKEEQDDANLFCITSFREQGEYAHNEDSNVNNVNVEEGTEEGGSSVCPYCYLDCHKSADLKKHLRSHTGERPHECEFCDLAFARASHLARHRRVHTGERPFTCSNCGRRFSRQDKLKQHIKRHHIEVPRLQSISSNPYPALLQGPAVKRGRGRPRKIRDPPVDAVPGDANSTSISNLPTETSSISLPFGDTSYLSSLSLGQQRYNDLTISPIVEPVSANTPSTSQNAHAEDLLKSVRQLGECTIQAFPDRGQQNDKTLKMETVLP